jgi:growth arrest-specific protein 8
VNDVESEKYKLEMRKEIRALRKILTDEEKLLSFYQQEREKINYNWIIAKKELEDRRSDFINKEREIQDLQENHFMTINLYK